MPLAERALAPFLKERGWGEVILANETFTIFSRTTMILYFIFCILHFIWPG